MSVAHDQAHSSTARHTRAGRFSYDTTAGTWVWDEQVYGILGLRPGAVAPSVDPLLSCDDPAHRMQVSAGLRRVETTGEPFHVVYRLSAGDGVDRWVLLAGEASTSVRPVREVVGRVVDLTEDLRREADEAARQAVADSARHRSTIDRAVGAVMVAYGLDADQAFEMLRWWSQDRNVKVRDLAARVTEAASGGAATAPPIRAMFDGLLHDVSTA